jgi:hypothetical protein
MAFDFTGGANRYLSVASAPASGSPMTIAGWFYATSTGGQAVICAVGQNGSPAHRNQLFMQGGGSVQAFAAGASGTDQPSSATSVVANEWSHCAGVYTSATSRTAYRNGTAGTAGTANIGTQNAANETLINARNNGSIGIISNVARIAEVGIWNVALTAAEIASLADGMTCDKVRPDSLVFYAPLVRDLIDYSGGLTITNNNSATVAVHPRVYA